MDPSTDRSWREGVDSKITQLESGVTEILAHLRSQTSAASDPSQAAAPVSTAPPTVSAFHEPRLSTPELFRGEPDQCRAFLTQCEIHFELQPSAFPSDRAKVAYVISLLAGRAKLWGTSEWQNNSYLCDSYQDFSEELVRVFSPILPSREASRGLLSLKQGSRSVSEFIIEFHLLTAESPWNEEALMDVFITGLGERIKDELSTRDYPRSLKELEELATRIDLRLQERCRERGPQVRHLTSSSGREVHRSTPGSPRSPGPEPMQLGRARLSREERDRRLRLRLCL